MTLSYSEIDAEGELRKRECSKEHRVAPIVQMGLLMDTRGLPIIYGLFSGNTDDCLIEKSRGDLVQENVVGIMAITVVATISNGRYFAPLTAEDWIKAIPRKNTRYLFPIDRDTTIAHSGGKEG